jgi:hypothetical protein
MPYFRFYLLPLLFVAATSFAQDMVEVDRVKFNSLRDNWVQMEIQLSCNGNPLPDAKNSRYLEDIGVKVYLAYSEDGAAGKFSYYISEVKIVIMEQGDKNNVYFYLPGLLVERDRLKTDPDYYYVELTVDGTALPPQERTSMSSSIKSLQILESMKSSATAAEEENKGKLMPVYFAPAEYLGRVDRLPTFLRIDPEI